MQLLTNVALLLGVVAIVVSWFVAVGLLKSDKAGSPRPDQTTETDARLDDVLTGSRSN